MEFLQLFDLLDKHQVRYMICGGLAVNIYGIPRSTADIDLLIDFEEKNVERFLITMKLLAYVGSLPFSLQILINAEERRQMIEQKNLITYSFFNSMRNTFLVDVLVKVPFSFNDMWERREERQFGQIPVTLVSVQDLILLKKAADREQDKSDVQLLSKLLKR